jgi:hypothetical protein
MREVASLKIFVVIIRLSNDFVEMRGHKLWGLSK